MKLDKKDKDILRSLQENCNMSCRDLGKKIGIPSTTVYQRRKALEKAGVITECTAVLDPEKIGVPTTAIVLVDLANPSEPLKVAKKIAEIPEVCEVHVMTGPHDLCVKIRGPNEKVVGREVIHKILSIKGVGKTLTCMSMFCPKSTQKIPLSGQNSAIP